MNPIVLHPIIFYMLIGMSVALLGAVSFLMFKMIKNFFADTIILLDKSNRFTIIKDYLKGLKRYTYQGKTYFLTDANILNSRGKSLYIFSENKPEPLRLSYNKAEWLDSETLLAVINNELIKKMLETKNKFSEVLMLMGSIGGIIAGIASVVILLIQTGVISGA